MYMLPAARVGCDYFFCDKNKKKHESDKVKKMFSGNTALRCARVGMIILNYETFDIMCKPFDLHAYVAYRLRV